MGLNLKEQKVQELFSSQMLKHGFSQEQVKNASKLWKAVVRKRKIEREKPEGWAAAVMYTIAQLDFMPEWSQKAVGKIFAVSATTVRLKYTDIQIITKLEIADKRFSTKHEEFCENLNLQEGWGETTEDEIRSLLERWTANDAFQLLERISNVAAILEIDPINKYALTELATLWLELENYKNARLLLEKLLDLYPEFTEAHLLMGSYYLENEMFEKAVDEFVEAIQLTPVEEKRKLSMLYNFLGIAQWNAGDRILALKSWKQAVENDPTNKSAHENLRECTNEYGMPKALDQSLDDLFYLFSVKEKEYLDMVGKEWFESEEKFQAVLERIQEAWDALSDAQLRELERMSTAEKVVFLQKLPVDFSDLF
ncbi:hypothetical protein DRP98_03750 [candidate division KSB1 bacterium]|nr:MAG: hypothetical protein DRP98_03750 [candidate division KSB1 bacterium]